MTIKTPSNSQKIAHSGWRKHRVYRIGSIAVAMLAGILLVGSVAANSSDWQTFYFVDEWGEATNKRGVQSGEQTVDVGFGGFFTSTSRIVFESDAFATMRFDYLNLINGSFQADGSQTFNVGIKIGARERTFRLKQPMGQNYLRLQNTPTKWILDAIKDDAGTVLLVRMSFYEKGNVAFRFPLDGAKEELEKVGFIQGS